MAYYNMLKFKVKSVLHKKSRHLFFKCITFVPRTRSLPLKKISMNAYEHINKDSIDSR